MSKIYLISPPKIDNLENFLEKLDDFLKTGKIPVFQLRLKNYSDEDVIQIGNKIKEICQKNNVLFILNDRFDLALKIGANGVHVGLEDAKNNCSIEQIRKKSPKNFVIGVSCYDSKDMAMIAAEQGANYVSFGTFFPSKTKNSQGKPNPEILKWCDEVLSVPTVAIGGINSDNVKILVENKADFIAVISCIWDNSNPKNELEKLCKNW